MNTFLIEHGLHVYRFNRVYFFERVIADQVCRVRIAVPCRDSGVFFPVMKRDGIKAGLSGIVHEINIKPTFCQVIKVLGDKCDIKGVADSITTFFCPDMDVADAVLVMLLSE